MLPGRWIHTGLSSFRQRVLLRCGVTFRSRWVSRFRAGRGLRGHQLVRQPVPALADTTMPSFLRYWTQLRYLRGTGVRTNLFPTSDGFSITSTQSGHSAGPGTTVHKLILRFTFLRVQTGTLELTLGSFLAGHSTTTFTHTGPRGGSPLHTAHRAPTSGGQAGWTVG